MNTVVLSLAAIVVAILTALFAIPPLVDWNAYRGVFEVEASRLLGRDVRVRGDVELSLLPVPYLQFEDVTIANAPGVTGEPFLRAKAFSLRLSAPPLLRGAIEAKQIDVEGARFRLRLDENGRGNWQDFQAGQARSGLVPTEISLNQVNFSDVGVTLERADGARVFQVGGVSGELSAPSARGPFRFSGTVNGSMGETSTPLALRVSTGIWDTEGGADVRVALAREADKKSLTIAGRLDALGEAPFRFAGGIEGDLAMLLPVVRAPADTGLQGRSLASGERRIEGGMQITPQQLEIADLKLELARAASPQVLLGSASWRLADDAPLEVMLRSDLLDADMLGLSGEKSDGLSLYRLGLEQLRGLRQTTIALGRPTNLNIRVDRLSLGRKSLSGIEFVARLSEQASEITRFKFQAPGATTGFADGRMETVGADTLAFSGALRLEGRNLQQFATWVWPGAPLAEKRAQRPFSLSTRVVAGDREIALSDTRATVGRDTVRGSGSYNSANAGLLEINAAGPIIDLSFVDPDLLSPLRLRSFFVPTEDGASVLPGQTNITLAAAEVRDARRAYRNVEVSAARSTNGAVVIRDLTFATPEGARVQARGALRPEDGKVTGRISGRVTTTNSEAAKALLEFAGAVSRPPQAEPASDGDKRQVHTLMHLAAARPLPPLDLAFSTEFGGDAETPLRFSADGSAGRDTISLAYSTQSADWLFGDAAVKIDISAAGAVALDVVRVARGLDAMRSDAREETTIGQQARARLIATGIPKRGMTATATLATPQTSLTYDGTLTLLDTGRWAGEGHVATVTRSARDMFMALHVSDFAGRLPNVALNATATLGPKDGGTRVALTELALGNVTGRGELMVSDGNAVSGTLRFNRLVLDDGFALLSREAGSAGPGVQNASRQPVWTATTLDLSVFDGLTADIAVSADAFLVAEAATFSRTAFRLKVSEDTVAMEDIKATTPLDGEVAGRVEIEARASGYGLSGTFEVTKASLAAFRPRADAAAAGGAAAPAGAVEVAFNLDGRGGSIQSLVALAKGEGRVRLRGVSLSGVSPAAIRAAGDAFGVKARITAGDLNEVLRRELLSRRSELGDQDLALRIRDGIVSVAPLRVGVDGGRIENTTTVALGTLSVDSRWRLTPFARESADEALPAVEVIYSSPLVDIATAEPELRTDALARELVVRRLEGNVAELERLRRLDEERARRQAELLAAREREAAARREAERVERERLEAERAGPSIAPEFVPGLTPEEGTVQRSPLPLPGQRSGLDRSNATPSRARTLALGMSASAPQPQVARRTEQAARYRSRQMRLGAARSRARSAPAGQRAVGRSRTRETGWRQRALFSNR